MARKHLNGRDDDPGPVLGPGGSGEGHSSSVPAGSLAVRTIEHNCQSGQGRPVSTFAGLPGLAVAGAAPRPRSAIVDATTAEPSRESGSLVRLAAARAPNRAGAGGRAALGQ